jgi:uncharacterized protein (TIGR00255 family)
MIRSMTGYGDAERDTPIGRLRLEVKTVNHRFFNASIKTPPGFDRYERELTEALRRHVARGHVSAYLSVDRSKSDALEALRVDLDKARQYQAALQAVADSLDVPGTVDLSMLARFGDVFRVPEPDGPPLIEAEVFQELADAAAQDLLALREAEGAKLYDDLVERLDGMAVQIATVEARAPERIESERQRLREAVSELSDHVDVDEDRLAREIAYLSDKWDINEEVVRFRSHVAQFRAALDADGFEPIGKRLGFLMQEMLREANTIASKANDAVIAHAAVALKEEIERVREQVENVE